MRRSKRFAAVCLVMALPLAGCGEDGDSGEGGSAPSLSKAEYIERGDAICKAIEEGTQGFPVPPPDAPAAAHEKFMSDVLEVVRDARGDFQSLDAPDGDTAAKETFDGYWDRVVSYVERARDAAAAEDKAAYDELLAELESDESLGEAFREYGFEVCGNT